MMPGQIAGQLKSWLTPSQPGPLQKAAIIIAESGKEIPVMYNPTELTFGWTVEYGNECNQPPQPKERKNEDFVVTLFFDTYEAQTSVADKTKEIVDLTKFSSARQDKRKMPPLVHFAWGGKTLYTGIVTRVEQTFTMFMPSGIPVRSTLKVTFHEMLTELEQAVAEGRQACRKLWRVWESDRLYMIAQQIYGDPALWPLIADANGIYDVLGFPTAAFIGKTIVIPDIHDETFEPKGEPIYV